MPVSNVRETPLLTHKRAEEIFTAAAAAARALGVRDVEVLTGAGANALTRFAKYTAPILLATLLSQGHGMAGTTVSITE